MRKWKKSKTKWEPTGLWYAPNTKEKLPGRLRKKQGRYVLDIITSRTFEGQEIPLSDVNVTYNNYEIIVGTCRLIYGEVCTLYGCRLVSTKSIGEGVSRLRYDVRYVFHNTLVEDKKALLVKAASFSFSNLSSWYDGDECINRFSDETGIYIDGKQVPKNRENKDKRVQITDNMAFVFEDRYETTRPDWNNSREQYFRKYLTIEYSQPVHFDELISDAAYFSRLLGVSMFKAVGFTIHTVQFTDEAYAHLKNEYRGHRKSSYVQNYTLTSKRKIEEDSLHQNYMLFSRWKFSEESLNEIIRKWFANRSHSYLYDYFIDSHVWTIGNWQFLTNVMFNNRFLNMLHGLEGFHEVFYGRPKQAKSVIDAKVEEVNELLSQADADAELKHWANDKLQTSEEVYPTLKKKLEHLLEEFQIQLLQRFGNSEPLKKFISKASKYRNLLSHGSIEIKETNQGKEMDKLFFALQYLLALCILKSLEIADCKASIGHNVRMGEWANEIVHFINNNRSQYC